jgi:CO/xanthine dehydrogenase FAD-binding subunit
MLPNLTEYHRPATLAEALRLLREAQTAPLAGGAHLLAAPNKALAAVVDLQSLGLRGLHSDGGRLRLGAMTTLAELAEAGGLAGNAGSLLRDAARRAGPNTYRNAATLGGLAASRPAASELLTALLALEAQVEYAEAPLASRSLADALAGSRRQNLIAALTLAWPAEGAGAAHRVGRTPSDSPIVHVTAWAGPNGVRVAAGGIADRTIRLPQVEQAVAAGLTEATIAAAAKAAESVSPPSDFRGSPEYRRAMLGVLLRRALVDLWKSN